MLGSSFQVMQKVVKFMKLSSQTIGSGGTEWSVPVFKSSDMSWIHRTVVSNTRFRWNREIGSSFQVMRKVVGFIELSSQTLGSGGTDWSVPVFRSCRKSLDSQNCRLKHSVPVEPSGRFQFSGHAESRWIHRTVVSKQCF